MYHRIGASVPNAVMPGHCPHVNVLRTTTFMNTPRSVLGRLTAPPRPMHTCAADPYVLSKLEETEKQYLELQEKMADPDVSGNQTQYQKLVKACSDIQDQVEAYQQYKETERQLEDAKAMIKGVRKRAGHGHVGVCSRRAGGAGGGA